MSRRMSCSMTIDAVRDRTKTVTRRHVNTWKNLKPGDRLTLIEKGMGLPKGAKQVVLAEVEVTHVDVEPISFVDMELDATTREGLPHLTPNGFIEFWLRGHGYSVDANVHETLCRRIEWRYLDDTETVSPVRPPRAHQREGRAPLAPRLDDVTPRGGARGGGRKIERGAA